MGFTNVPRASVLRSGTTSGTPYLQLGDPYTATPTSRWGIDAHSRPYYDDAGAAAGESATPELDAVTGAPDLIR